MEGFFCGSSNLVEFWSRRSSILHPTSESEQVVPYESEGITPAVFWLWAELAGPEGPST